MRHLLVSRTDLLSRVTVGFCVYVCVGLEKRNTPSTAQHVSSKTGCFQEIFSHCFEDTERQKPHVCDVMFVSVTLQPHQEEDGQMQRPEVRKEDLIEGTNRLGLTGPAKSKTLQVMEECGEDKCIQYKLSRTWI